MWFDKDRVKSKRFMVSSVRGMIRSCEWWEEWRMWKKVRGKKEWTGREIWGNHLARQPQILQCRGGEPL